VQEQRHALPSPAARALDRGLGHARLREPIDEESGRRDRVDIELERSMGIEEDNLEAIADDLVLTESGVEV
jgi:hypothetical protein